MAHTGIFATAIECVRKAGAGASTTATASEQFINDLCTQAESYINVRTMKNWSDIYVTPLNVDVKAILKECASNIVGMYLIMYNMDGYSSTTKAQTMLNVLRDRIEADIETLKEIAKRDFMVGA